MKTYYVYDFQTDEFLCEVRAWSVVDAEIRACKQLSATIRHKKSAR